MTPLNPTAWKAEDYEQAAAEYAALQSSWRRYWESGRLLEHPEELERRLEDWRQQVEKAKREKDEALQRAVTAEAELTRLRETLARLQQKPDA